MAQDSNGGSRLVSVISNKQNSVTARFFSSKNQGDYLCKRIVQQQKNMQLIEYVMINRKDYYQTVKCQSSVCKSTFNIKATEVGRKGQLQIFKPFISGQNLKTYFIKLAQSQQTLDFKQIKKLIAGILDLFVRGGGCPYFIYTLENIIINQDQQLEANVTSMVGFKFLAFQNQVIKQEQFREISHYLDVKVFTRQVLSSKYNYELMETNFAVLLLNVILQREIILTNISAPFNKTDRQTYLKQIKSKWPTYLTIKGNADRINQFSNFMGVNLTQLFKAILIEGQYLSWGQIREMIFGVPKREENSNLQIYSKIADQKWKSMTNKERQFFVTRKLVKAQSWEWSDREKRFYLNMMLGLDFNKIKSEEELIHFLQDRKFNKDYHSFWLFCLKQYPLREVTVPETTGEQPNISPANSLLESSGQWGKDEKSIEERKQIVDQNNSKLSELYQIANNKLVLEHKGAVFQQQYLKSFRTFMRPLRSFFKAA